MQPGLGTRTLVHLTMHFSDIPMKECSDSELPHREITAKKKTVIGLLPVLSSFVPISVLAIF